MRQNAIGSSDSRKGRGTPKAMAFDYKTSHIEFSNRGFIINLME